MDTMPGVTREGGGGLLKKESTLVSTTSEASKIVAH